MPAFNVEFSIKWNKCWKLFFQDDFIVPFLSNFEAILTLSSTHPWMLCCSCNNMIKEDWQVNLEEFMNRAELQNYPPWKIYFYINYLKSYFSFSQEQGLWQRIQRCYDLDILGRKQYGGFSHKASKYFIPPTIKGTCGPLSCKIKVTLKLLQIDYLPKET